MVLDTVSRPLSLLPVPLARLDARRDGFEWFVFNRRGLHRVLTLAGFAVEAMTPTFHDRYARLPDDRPPSLGTRARHAVGLRGLSVAARARPVTARAPAAPARTASPRPRASSGRGSAPAGPRAAQPPPPHRRRRWRR
jgi:hypothetical protein